MSRSLLLAALSLSVLMPFLRATDEVDPVPAGATKLWLRLTKRRSSYEYASSADGKKWTVHHFWE